MNGFRIDVRVRAAAFQPDTADVGSRKSGLFASGGSALAPQGDGRIDPRGARGR